MFSVQVHIHVQSKPEKQLFVSYCLSIVRVARHVELKIDSFLFILFYIRLLKLNKIYR